MYISLQYVSDQLRPPCRNRTISFSDASDIPKRELPGYCLFPCSDKRKHWMTYVATDGFEIFLTFLMLDGSAANETKVFLFPMKSLLLSSRKRLSRVHVPTKWAWLKGIIIRDLFHKLSELAGCASISLLFLRSIRQYTPKKLFAGYCSLLPSKPTTKHNPWEV